MFGVGICYLMMMVAGDLVVGVAEAVGMNLWLDVCALMCSCMNVNLSMCKQTVFKHGHVCVKLT